jgi:ATP-dependent Lhr-like helicase
VHESTFLLQAEGDPVLLLAGHSWKVTHIDWSRQEAFVEPAKQTGKSRWLGVGQPLHFRLCRAIRRVLTGRADETGWSRRAVERLAALRSDFPWLDERATTLVRGAGRRIVWWTFAGQLANETLTQLLRELKYAVSGVDNLCINFLDASADMSNIIADLRDSPWQSATCPVSERSLDRVKFSNCLPRGLAVRSLAARLADPAAVGIVLEEPLRIVSVTESA